MEDIELVQLVAEKVMGWAPTTFEKVIITTTPTEMMFYVSDGMVWTFGPPDPDGPFGGACNYVWNPLQDDADLFAIVDKVAADWSFSLESARDSESGELFWHAHMCRYRSGTGPWADDADRRRASVIAILRAYGVTAL